MLSTESFPTADLGVITCHGSARNILLLSDSCALLVSALPKWNPELCLAERVLEGQAGSALPANETPVQQGIHILQSKTC